MRDKLVLVHYINIGNIDHSDVEGYIERIRNGLSIDKDEALTYFIPIREGETRVECINPRLVNVDVFKEAVKKLVKAESEMMDVIKNYKES